MAKLLSHLNPIPGFPGFTGPYDVGTVDLEIPISELSSPSEAQAPTPEIAPPLANASEEQRDTLSPPPNFDITTISFRIFYPCEPTKSSKSPYWLPTPQTEYLKAYARFLGASPRLATLSSFVLPEIPNFSLLIYLGISHFRDSSSTPLYPPMKMPN